MMTRQFGGAGAFFDRVRHSGMVNRGRSILEHASVHYRLFVVGGLVILGLLYSLYARTYPYGGVTGPGPGFIPFWVGAAMTVVVLLTLVLALVRGTPEKSNDALAQEEEADRQERAEPGGGARTLLFLLILIVYARLLDSLGHFVSAIVMLMGTLLLLHARRIWQQAVFALGLTVVSYVVFEVLLNVPLPKGPGL